jgi:hypothetical protein
MESDPENGWVEVTKDSQGYEFHISGKSGDAVGYLRFPAHPPGIVPGVVHRALRLSDLIGAYDGRDVVIDLDEHNRLIGIEIVE